MKVPAGLSDGGRTLWKQVTDAHELDITQLVQLEEACRAKDRCDQLDALLSGDVSVWAEIVDPDGPQYPYLAINDALNKANATANLMKQLLAALRLPDAAGKRPQGRGAPRGAHQPKGSAVSSLERARQRTAG